MGRVQCCLAVKNYEQYESSQDWRRGGVSIIRGMTIGSREPRLKEDKGPQGARKRKCKPSLLESSRELSRSWGQGFQPPS